MSLRERVDYQRLLTLQFPPKQHRVVYSRSGSRLVAAYVEPPQAIVDTKLYWAAVGSREEADYLTAILNSLLMTELVNPLQGKGQFGPRDYYKLPFEFPIPSYDATAELHTKLAMLGHRCAQVVAGVPDASLATFRRARSAAWKVLADAGLLAELDDAVTDLLLA
jgi:hypothetical protein